MNFNTEIYHTVQQNDTLYNMAPIQTYISQTMLDVINTYRLLWEQHGAWTRMAISSLVFDTPDKEFTIKRLLRNPKDFSVIFKYFYGDMIGNQFDELLTEHLVVAADLVNAAKTGDTELVGDIEKRWYQNGMDIARFLNQINPYYLFEDWKKMMFDHLELVKMEAVELINKDFQKSVETYDTMESQILKMADMMSHGLIKQFNIT